MESELPRRVGMKDFLRSTEHLLRVAVLLVLGLVAFFLVRQAVIPAEFGKYGHFRPGALDDIRAHPVKFAGHEACEACHSDEAAAKRADPEMIGQDGQHGDGAEAVDIGAVV